MFDFSSHFGNVANFEAQKNKKNTEKTMIATLLTTILYNCLLIFLIKYYLLKILTNKF